MRRGEIRYNEDMKLLVVCSSLDLKAPFSATPAWWQLLKGLYEVGVDLIVTAYHGEVPETLWWRAYPNPARREGELFACARNAFRSLNAGPSAEKKRNQSPSFLDRAIPPIAQTMISPRWRRHLAKILRAEPGIDAMLLISVPPNHLRGVAGSLRREFGKPVLFYDGDVPASLPDYQGFATGFRIYPGADLAEFDAVLSNSKGGQDSLRRMGARATHVLYYAADPQIYRAVSVPQDIDVFFYGTTAEYRAEWLRALIAVPSEKLPEVRFAVRGRRLGGLGRAELLPFSSFSGLRSDISRSKINLVITRQSHAGLYGSSTLRPFELAMLGACLVCSPYLGIGEWFEPEKEIIVAGSAEEAVDRYQFLLRNDAARIALGEAARTRALAEHTYSRRAGQLVEIIKGYL
jgi:hypothetical protein